MRAWWEQQAEREQRLLLAVAAVVILAILYWGLWAPLANGAAHSEQQRLAAERELEWLQAQAEGYIRSGGGAAPSAAPADAASMSTVVNNSSRTFSIAISRMQPQGEMLQLWIDEVPWKQLLGWLEQLQREHGIVVNSVDLARGDSQGRVKVRRLELTRG